MKVFPAGVATGYGLAVASIGLLILLGGAAAAAPPAGGPAAGGPAAGGQGPSPQDVLARTKPSDWRALDPQNTLYLELASGRVVLQLAPRFAPQTIANIKTLVRQQYFDGLSIVRLQDNYVAQFGDPDGKRDLGGVAPTLAPEFWQRYTTTSDFNALPDRDVYAPQVGFIDSWPVARDPKAHEQWLAHCYGMLGVGRDTAADSGTGAELYVVIGHSPRQLDRNVTLVGRVVQGIEQISSLPRGTGNMGFYEKSEQYMPITTLRIAADLPPEQRTGLEVLRSDTPIFRDYVASLRSRRTAWFVEPTSRIELCNVRIPVRRTAAAAALN